MDNMTKRVALKELRKLKARDAEYQAERDEWYRSGDGRAPKWRTNPRTGRQTNYGGKGYAFPYCEHGTSLWTDHDNICGGCEDGYNIYQLAIWSAQEKVAEYNRRFEWYVSGPSNIPPELRRELVNWVVEPIPAD